MSKLIAIILSLFLMACAGSNFKWDTARQIKQGMAETELFNLMGKPSATRSSADGVIYVWTSVNGLTGSVKTVSVIVKDGKVVSAPVIPDNF